MEKYHRDNTYNVLNENERIVFVQRIFHERAYKKAYKSKTRTTKEKNKTGKPNAVPQWGGGNLEKNAEKWKTHFEELKLFKQKHG